MKQTGNRTKKLICAALLGTALFLPFMVSGTPISAKGVEKTDQNALEVTALPGCQAKDLQALLDANASGAYDKLIVNIPAGTYELSSTLYISSNTVIKASQEAYLKKMKVYGAMLEGRLTGDQGGYDGCVNITVDGGVWDSKAVMAGKEGTETFRFIHCSGVTVKNAVLCNVPEGSHLIVFSGSENALVDGCEFYGYGKGGGGKTEKEAVQLDIAHDVTITPTMQDVMWDDLPCRNITIQNCNFHDFSRAFGSHTTVKGIYHDGIVLRDNTVKNMLDVAFKLFNYTNTTVSGNTFENCGYAVFAYTWLDAQQSEEGGMMYLKPLKEGKFVLPESCNIVIENNVFNMGKGYGHVEGDAVRICGSKEIPIPGVTVKDNTILGGKRYGIFATQAPNMVISGNQISETKSNGILIEEACTSCAIRDNTVKNAAGKAAIGIYTASDGTVVSGNVITSPAESGIYLYDGVKNCIIGAAGKETKETDKNQIVKPGTTGIHITNGCEENKVWYNEIENAAEAGIWVYESKNNTISWNTVNSPKQAGIHVTVKSSGNTVSGNTVKNAGTDGIRLHQSENCTVTSNTIASPKKNGINVTEKSQKTVVRKNKISQSGEDGIWVSGSASCTISSNTINKYACKAEKNYGIGIYQSGGSKSAYAKIESNTITGSGSKTGNNAIHVNGSDYVLMNKNTIKTPAGYGIYIYMSKNNKASANKITKPVKGGIYATTACDRTVITGNTVTSPGDTAIMVFQANNSEITSNTVKVSKEVVGIRVSQSNKAAIKKNKVAGAEKTRAVWITGSEGCTEEGTIVE